MNSYSSDLEQGGLWIPYTLCFTKNWLEELTQLLKSQIIDTHHLKCVNNLYLNPVNNHAYAAASCSSVRFKQPIELKVDFELVKKKARIKEELTVQIMKHAAVTVTYRQLWMGPV